MTLIIGFKQNNMSYMACDKIVSGNGLYSTIPTKIVDTKDSYDKKILIGWSGNVNVFSALNDIVNDNEFAQDCNSITDIMRIIKKNMIELGIAKDNYIGAILLILYDGKFYQTDNYFGWFEVEDNFLAIGSGDDIAKGINRVFHSIIHSHHDICRTIFDNTNAVNPTIGTEYVLYSEE